MMKDDAIPNLKAEIIPGRAAAGFSIGQPLIEVCSSISDPKQWNPSVDGQLSYGIYTNAGWLRHDYEISVKPKPIKVVDLFYKNNVVQLHVRDGVLDSITVGNGYFGSFLRVLKIGTDLEALKELSEVNYDDMEEVHFFSNSEYKGIAFYLDNENKVSGIMVHDLTIQFG